MGVLLNLNRDKNLVLYKYGSCFANYDVDMPHENVHQHQPVLKNLHPYNTWP